MVIGDKEELAFELIKICDLEGELYLYIKGERVGIADWLYDLEMAKKAFLYEIGNGDRRFYPDLVAWSVEDISRLFECVWADFEAGECSKYKSLGVSASDIDNILFFSPPYIFDGWGVGLVQGEKSELFFVYDEEASKYMGVTLARNGFYGMVEILLSEM